MEVQLEKETSGHVKKSSVSYLYKLVSLSGMPKMLLGTAALLSIASSLTGLVWPVMTGRFIDQFTTGGVNGGLIALLVGVFLLEALTSGVSYYMLAYAGNQTVTMLRKRLWSKTLSLPIHFFDRHRSADVMSRIANDTDEIRTLITEHLISFFSNLLTVIGALAILFWLDWRLTLVVLLAAPLGAAIIVPIGSKMYGISMKMYDQLAQFASVLTQVIGEIRLVKYSNAEKREETNGFEKVDNLFRLSMRETKIYAILSPLMSMIMVVLLVAVVAYGGMRVSSGALSTGVLVSFVLLLFQVILPINTFATFYSNLQKVSGAADRLKAILEAEAEQEAKGLAMPSDQRDLVFNSVSFAYSSDEPVLKNVDLTLRAGQVTALVGPSGSGKTTVFSLIERFYSPTKGMITYGDQPIDDFDIASFRSRIGYVSQESPLVHGTIRDNIVYGRMDPVTEEEMIEASKLAYAHHFISSLPNGYDTEVGERGIRLSGGQKQRIAIARAVLRNPDILLLDEATASLDSDSEHEVQKALQRLMSSCTTVVIAHRLSTVTNADQIVVLEFGQITGTGRHHELLETHSSYAEWTKKQFRHNQDHTPQHAIE
ncbi:ABC transporter ATP-binding protein [Paenibacillus tarimensis]|uniref:ABC transporter ATP-binding protein n=1 Tax=Paenibacillus tarimensis TaxID=416012 RepID=UPI001F212E56|nr:ABC transporter ATP-binding protein [Paenibacillus tarimensis]MCF2945766.1 ABC transporter ATP-binding protein/permease [Paenibacillus tarimensis]